ncbi:hypothetical protein NLX67_13360 [Domibacillus sp. A3M-37]|uniref:hypothetical protein n=1 Tax=Domibacillus TaxID=1433999 RepID=UPI0020B6B0F3|nr:hypothetical protein [Domibacillus sp. A3M-37]MCP3763370.1 hypothetical protein [Domibacillus sp. A3M-37]
MKKKGSDIVIYSMYGKYSSTTPKAAIKKIWKDLQDALNFAEEKGCQLKVWNLVINYALDTDLNEKLC